MRVRWMLPLLALSLLLLTWVGLNALKPGDRATVAMPGATVRKADGGEAAVPAPPAPVPSTPDAAAAPHRIEIHGDDLILGTYRGKLPERTVAYGIRTILLPGVAEEVAHIELALCPGAIPVESGCIGNHRAPVSTREIAVAGLQTRAYVVEYSLPSTANDTRVWQEIHTFLPLPGSDRLDLVSVVLKESGKEQALNEAYQRLLGSIRRDL